MTDYIATFHTHLSAMRSHRSLTGAGVTAALAPVPRALSASCGTCVRYTAEEPHLSSMDGDVESVVAVGADGGYTELFHNE